MKFTKEYLLHYFDYHRDFGVLIWKTAPAFNKKHLIGRIAGRESKRGYREVRLFHKMYSVYKLIWFIENNEWSDMIDHINGDRTDNRIVNLRSVTARENQQNRKVHRNGKLVGTTYRKDCNAWLARAWINGKNKRIGLFATEQEAHDAYLDCLREKS